MSSPTTPGDGRVAVVLMKSQEADATIDVMEVDHPDVKIVDQGTYWYFEHPSEINVDMQRVSEELGQELSVSQWLVVMTTFVGRAAPDEHGFRVTADMLELDEPALGAAER
jgi:hypothetical protein